MKARYRSEQVFWDRKGANEYISLSGVDQQRIRTWIAWTGEGRVLDIGGGSGMVSRIVASEANTHCICVDISLAMLLHAPVSAVQADALRLPFAENSFDLIIAAAFLHHIPGMEASLFAEALRVLKPEGRLVGYDPNAHSLQNRIFMANTPLRLGIFSPDERPLLPEHLHDVARNSGFSAFYYEYFSFRNQALTVFEAIQRYLLNPAAKGPLRPFLERWFFWQAVKTEVPGNTGAVVPDN